MLTFSKNSFIPFVTAGHPDLEATLEIVLALAGVGSAVVEIGIPFSDPVADGPTIQRSSFSALQHGYSMSDYIELVRRIRMKSDVGLIFMTYMNPVLQFGLDRLDDTASAAGLDGVLISDLTPEEYLFQSSSEGVEGSSYSLPRFQRLQTVFLVAPTSTEPRIRLICKASTGFVYLVARTGVTGRHTDIDETLPQTVSQIRRYTGVPIAVGFGIRSKDDVRRVWQFADAAVVGSAIVSFIERNRDQRDLAERVAGYVKAELLPEEGCDGKLPPRRD